MTEIHKELIKREYESYVIYSNGAKVNNDNILKIGSKLSYYFHILYSHFFCKQGFASSSSTKRIIRELDRIKPDIVHLHNLHGNFINIELLFNYLKIKNIKTLWTFHDCWAFTGKCVHFENAKCFKWKYGCNNCPILFDSPTAYVDKTNWCYKRKKNLFENMDLTIVSPSKWLSNYIKESFLKDYKLYVINNGIDLDIFKRSESNFRDKYNIKNKKIILGVASSWSKRKGIYDFFTLSKILDDSYIIVLVGLSKKVIKSLPNNIIGITRTENQQQLANIYSSADIFFNPTYEDTYPTVNLEALACGTPVLTYDTGGSPEIKNLIDKTNKIEYVLPKQLVKTDFTIVKKYIDNILDNKQFFKVKNVNLLDKQNMIKKYIELYNKLQTKEVN